MKRGSNILWPLHIFVDLRKKIMPITIEQEVVIAENTEEAINTEIQTYNGASFMLTSITVSGENVILLFTKATAAA